MDAIDITSGLQCPCGELRQLTKSRAIVHAADVQQDVYSPLVPHLKLKYDRLAK
jgi:hypothetical protein